MAMKLLLVDDEEQFVEVLAQRLSTRGYEVKTAFDGDAAIEMVKAEEVDVVILDVLMPGKDGLSTLKEIKSIKPDVEVIMLTGDGAIETAIEGTKLGAYDYLMKPIDTSDLVNKIGKAYQRRTESRG